MKKSLILLIVLMWLPLVAQEGGDRPVAVIRLHRTEVIPQSKFEQYVQVLQRQVEGEALNFEQKKVILDVMINQILVKQDASSRNISVSDEEVMQTALQQLSMELQQIGLIPQGAILTDPAQFREVLANQQMNPDLYLENIKNNLLIQKYILETRQVDFQTVEPATEMEIRSFYNANIAMFAVPEYVRIRQIYFDKNKIGVDVNALRQEAQELMRKIESGQVSFDTALIDSGDLFPVSQDRVQPVLIAQGDAETIQVFGLEFANGLFENKVIGRPYFMESNLGYHILVIDNREEATVRTLDEAVSPIQNETVQQVISQIIMGEKQRMLYAQLQQTVVLELREQAGEEGIRVFEEVIR